MNGDGSRCVCSSAREDRNVQLKVAMHPEPMGSPDGAETGGHAPPGCGGRSWLLPGGRCDLMPGSAENVGCHPGNEVCNETARSPSALTPLNSAAMSCQGPVYGHQPDGSAWVDCHRQLLPPTVNTASDRRCPVRYPPQSRQCPLSGDQACGLINRRGSRRAPPGRTLK